MSWFDRQAANQASKLMRIAHPMDAYLGAHHNRRKRTKQRKKSRKHDPHNRTTTHRGKGKKRTVGGSKFNKLERKVKQLSKEAGHCLTTLTVKATTDGVLHNYAAATDRMETTVIKGLSDADYEADFTALPLFDDTTGTWGYKPLSLVTIPNLDMMIKYRSSELTLKCASEAAANIRVYCIKPRGRHDYDPKTMIVEGIDEVYNPHGNAILNVRSPLTWISESPKFKQHFSIIANFQEKLQPGEESTFKSPALPETKYRNMSDAATGVGHTGTAYSPNDVYWVVQCYGELAFGGTDGTEIGWGYCKLNYYQKSLVTYKYNGGGPGIKQYRIREDAMMQTFTGAHSSTVQTHDASTETAVGV